MAFSSHYLCVCEMTTLGKQLKENNSSSLNTQKEQLLAEVTKIKSEITKSITDTKLPQPITAITYFDNYSLFRKYSIPSLKQWAKEQNLAIKFQHFYGYKVLITVTVPYSWKTKIKEMLKGIERVLDKD